MSKCDKLANQCVQSYCRAVGISDKDERAKILTKRFATVIERVADSRYVEAKVPNKKDFDHLIKHFYKLKASLPDGWRDDENFSLYEHFEDEYALNMDVFYSETDFEAGIRWAISGLDFIYKDNL